MSADHPTASAKPSKPYPDFPPTPPGAGRRRSAVRCTTSAPGRIPTTPSRGTSNRRTHCTAAASPDPEALTVKALANAYLNHKQALLDAGELSPRTESNYKEAADLIVAEFGRQRVVADLGPDDFAALRNKMAKKWGPVRVRDFVQRVRSVFKYGFDTGLMPTPMRFGPRFARPSKKPVRLNRACKGPRMFEALEIRRMLGCPPWLPAAGPPLAAMILLGVNCGFGNADVGTLPLSALGLDGGWVNYHRPKTGITHRCALWPESVAAIREALAARPEPKDPAHAELVFVTKYGGSWHKAIEDYPVSKEMRTLLDALGINGHRNFYTLRHTFETVGGEAKDQVVSDHVRGWLFGNPVGDRHG
jgi:integrase